MSGGRRGWLGLSIAALLTVAILAGFGASLHHSQTSARQSIESRFAERVSVSAAMTESLFAASATASQATTAKHFGTARVSTATLAAHERKGQLANLLLLDSKGRIIARSPRTTDALAREIARRPAFVRPALAGRRFSVSDVITLEGNRDTIQFAQPLATPSGTRVLISGFSPRLLYAFISGYLAEIPKTAGAHAYVLDGRGNVLGGPRLARPGVRVSEPGLIEAVSRAGQGSFGTGRYFAATPVENSRWRVVLTARRGELFSSVEGSSKWVPWLLLAAFGLVAAFALLLVSRMVRASSRLRVSQERFALAVEGANDGIWDRDFVTDAVYFSPRWKAMLGYREHEIGSSEAEWNARVHPEDIPGLASALAAHFSGDAPHFESEHRMKHRDGTYRWFLTRGVAIRDADGKPTRMAGSMSDITERKAAEAVLRRSALHDSLTGLPNRTLFLDRLSQSLARAKREPDHRCAVLFLDLDRFKRINDGFSHAVGDELLIALGERLTGILRPSDTVARGIPDGLVARLGGDEFTILIEDLDTPARAAEIARRIQTALLEPFLIRHRELLVTASVGIAISATGSSALELMRNADIAMYDAKRQGTGRSSIFTEQMHSQVRDQIELETQLRTVIEERDLRVFYQPVVNLTTGELTGFEALARWPECDAPVAPDRFIAIAEDSGLIADLGRFVLEQACNCLGDWRRRGIVDDAISMSVNVSGRQLGDPHLLVSDVKAALASSGIPARCLRLEITESTVIRRPERARAALDELALLGVRAEIDDFGTGYASLTFLQSFPGDTLKIDRSFISTMHEHASQEAIVRAIVALALNLGMNVVAEGIEHPHQLVLLRSIGCTYGQGYLLARPADAQSLEPVIVAWDTATAGLEPSPLELADQPNVNA